MNVSPDSARERALLLGLQLLLLVPFFDRPLHIDDALWLQIARHVQVDPWQPLDFIYNWTGVPGSVHGEMKNPPGVAYYLAWLASWSGESVRAMHAGMSLFAIVASQSVYSLARRVTQAPLYAAALFAVCPAFWVSATSLMVDVPMVAFMLLALLGLVRAGEATASSRNAVAGVVASCGGGLAAAASILSKYFAVSILPLFAAHLYFAREDSPLAWRKAPVFVLPIAAFAIWWWAGDAHVLGAVGYRATERASFLSWFATHGLSTASFSGALLAFPVVAWAGALADPAQRGQAAICAALGLLASIAFHVFYGFPFQIANDALLILSVAGGAVLGMDVLAGARSLWAGEASPLRRTLLLWLGGGLCFAIVFNWTVNARTILLFAAPAVLVFGWRSEGKPALRTAALGVSALAGLGVGLADAEFASFGPAEVARTQRDFAGAARVRFIGHWGFQHYMEEAGYAHVDIARPDARPGDVVVIPQTHRIASVPTGGLPPFVSTSVAERPRRLPVAVMDEASGAGLHGSFLGPLPFAFVPLSSPLERVEVARW